MSLDDECRVDVITQEPFAGALNDYPAVVPLRARDYENLRYVAIPSSVSARRGSGKPDLGKSEVVSLVDWKLSHGTFRPKLKQLVQSNPPDAVKETTAAAFSSFDGSLQALKSSLKQLCTLKGIGPATASLLLSVAFPNTVPFFSDELFRWAFWEEAKGKGWDRPVKYSAIEYHDLYSKVQELRDRHDWAAVDIEKVAFVLGNRSSHKSIIPPGDASSTRIVGSATETQEARGRIVKKRSGLELDESPPPTKKTKQDHELSPTRMGKTEHGDAQNLDRIEQLDKGTTEKMPAKRKTAKQKRVTKKSSLTGKTSKAPTVGGRSSSRLKGIFPSDSSANLAQSNY